ncbi:MAG: 4-(cytidine 5-diphospho)-2-C-methyl-D-erythritol kinase [Marmoricola sp.]|nr:4-(cytidine 5-diphospho)-2-C-methyl-D-erythritol kinase [Marmoricola sp.]
MSTQAAPSVTVRAPAKVNLSLVVGPVREDGFHPLDTVYQAISLYDDVTVTAAAGWSVTVTPVGGVDCSGVPLDESNLAVRAGRLLVEHHGLDRAAAIAVHKGIPVAGGLAGGSADAAATLVALDRLWDLGTSDEDLLRLAGELGSDVPFALVGGTAHGTGRGEVVEPVSDNGSWWWVVVPDATGLSTPAVYAELDRQPGPPTGAGSQPVREALATGDHAALAAALRNDLQAPALRLRPELAATVERVSRTPDGSVTGLALAAAPAVLLSGSGPTVLALCATQDDARAVRAGLLEEGFATAHVATGPVAGAHVVEYV